MKLNSIFAAATVGALVLAACGTASAASQIVDISALGPGGTSVGLGAGTYTIHFIDSAAGGLYDGYSPWSSSSGCDGAGTNCSTGFVESLAIDFGHGTSNFDHVDGFQYGLIAGPGDNHIYATGAQALAAIQTGQIFGAPLPTATDQNAYSAVLNPLSFTLAAAQPVDFFVFDSAYGDNRGGVSIQLSTPDIGGAPEPATWLTIILGLGAIGFALRRRPRAAHAVT